jgi:hypothetical protein
MDDGRAASLARSGPCFFRPPVGIPPDVHDKQTSTWWIAPTDLFGIQMCLLRENCLPDSMLEPGLFAGHGPRNDPLRRNQLRRNQSF